MRARARLGKLLLQRSTATVGMLYRFWYVTVVEDWNLRCGARLLLYIRRALSALLPQESRA